MSEDDSVLPVGTRIDQYEIIGLLGRGGFGITYLVRDDALQKEFALKEFFPEDLVRRDGVSIRFANKTNSENDYRWGLRKFFDEARLLAQFNHPNIVSVRRVFEANGTAYMLLDFIKGSTLEKWLQGLDSPPTQEELDLIAGPLLNALELVHANRSWHLDVSPENIMIRSADGQPILLDFGASRFEIKQHSQLVSALVFKSGYSAPEQYTSNADRYGPWTDIYATGATFYRAICGNRPTEATSRQMSDDLKGASEAAKGRYRPQFLKAIDAALKLQPQARPQSIEEWRKMLLGGTAAASAANPTRILRDANLDKTRVIDIREFAGSGAGAAAGGASGLLSRSVAGSPRGRQVALAAGGLVGALLLLGLVDLAVPDAAVNPYTYVKAAGRNLPVVGSAARGHCSSIFNSNGCWGAVVEKQGSIFARVEESRKEDAESNARLLCERQSGASGCRMIATISKRECWVLAEVPNKPVNWRAAVGPTFKEASASATTDCERNFGYCRVAVTACADGSNKN
ncbi:MAG: protein kinase [Hyphomicrobiaceae bacterium]|nr:protein kinase [Hyphomicrobiaceae bacterium]